MSEFHTCYRLKDLTVYHNIVICAKKFSTDSSSDRLVVGETKTGLDMPFEYCDNFLLSHTLPLV
tara:strand:- start:398 stop:589 length:192 start_codon:yes stop_codon:yes gene_type:complete